MFTCVYCKYLGSILDFEIDHIIPTSKGGSDLPQNKHFICSGCNREKGDKSHTEYITWRSVAELLGLKPNYGPIKGGV